MLLCTNYMPIPIMPSSRLLLLVSIPLTMLLASCASSKRGNPNLKPFKAEKKRARKGDPKAGLILVKACRGSMMTPDDKKDYKKALRFYEKYVADKVHTLPPGEKGERVLFDMYFTGGYGIDPNIEKARYWINELAKHKDLSRHYTYKDNLYLPHIFTVQKRGGLSQANAAYRMARYLLEYGIHFDKGMAWIEKAIERGHPDAPYYKARWLALRRQRKYDRPEDWSEFLRKKVMRIASQHIEKSPAARLEYAYIRTLDHRNLPEPTEIEELMEPLVTRAGADPGAKIKGLMLLEKVQKGGGRLKTLRRIRALEPSLDSADRVLAAKHLSEAKEIEEKMRSLSGLHELMEEREEFSDLDIDLEGYEKGYEGDMRPLVEVYEAIKKPENAELLGEEHLKEYELELSQKIETTFREADTPEKVLAMNDAFSEEPVLEKYAASYRPRVRSKLREMGVSTEEIDYFAEKKKLDEETFGSWQEAKAKMRAISDDPNINPMAQMRLRSYIKYKVIRDMYGENPSRREIEQLRNTLYRQTWLSPEGDKMCFAYMRDSENWFTGEVRRHSYMFQYTVTRDNPASDEYDLKINYVHNGLSNLAYKSTLKVKQLDADTYVVAIYLAERKSYRWAESKSDYLKAIYRQEADEIEPTAIGKLSRARRTDHGVPEHSLKQKEDPGDFSAKTAVRTALRYFILEYVGAMNI